jgi:carboxyl-terminal processing protease
MRAELSILLTLSVAACGGGGGSTPGTANPFVRTQTPTPAPTTWTAGIFQPSASSKAQCAAPRSGINPETNQPYSDVQGSSTAENHWLRSWTNETYLWYAEVPDLDPALHTTSAYFPLLKSSATTPSGNPKDKFHFTYSTPDWLALSQSGAQAGYGAEWFALAAQPPRRIVVAYVEPSSPAALAGMARGDEVLTVDGVNAVSGNTPANVNTINAGLFPASAGATHTFGMRTVSGAPYTTTMQSVTVVSTPVQSVSVLPNSVGYLVFNSHIATSETQLINAITTLRNAAVTDLILDIRYNGGGYLDIASELAYMIAGPVPTAGRTFERLTFNDKNPTTDPVTGQALAPIPFHTTTQGFQLPAGQALPTLNLPRVFVITGSGTCSASESIINSLRGVDVTVVLIGTTTCGKPYGFYPTDNCGTTYFSIQFKGVNARNFGEYSDGFSPLNSVAGAIGVTLPGCAVSDDFSHALGDTNELRIAAALQYRNTGTCPTPPTNPIGSAKTTNPATEEGRLLRVPAREIRVLRPE